MRSKTIAAHHQMLDALEPTKIIAPTAELFSYSEEMGMLGFLIFLGGILLIGTLIGTWEWHIFHIGKSHRAVAEHDGFLKTV